MNNPEHRPAEPWRGDSNDPEAVDGGVSLPEPSAQKPDVQQPDVQQPDGQQHPGQYSAGEQHSTEQYATEQYAADPYAAGPYAGPSYPTAQYADQGFDQYPGQQYPAQQYPAQQYPDAQSATEPNSAGHYAGADGNGQQHPDQQSAQFSGHDAGPQGSAPGPAPTRTRRPRVDANGIAYGVGRFSVREVVFLILSGLVVVASFLPFIGGIYAELFGYASLWSPAPWLVVPGTLLLAAAATLIVLRRLRPELGLRVGSLSVDQFASVAAVTTAGFYLGALFLFLGIAAWFGSGSFGARAFGENFEVFQPGAGLILGLIFSLAALVPTTCWRFIPVFADDFRARAEIPAHPVARRAVAVPVRPRPARAPRPVPQPEVHQYGDEYSGSIQLTPADTRPEDVAAYRRRGWSPDTGLADSATDAATEPGAQTASGLTGSHVDGDAEAEYVSIARGEGPEDAHPPVTFGSDIGESTPVEPAAVAPNSATDTDDEIDEFHTGEEPAPVSAVRHVAEQESRADDEGFTGFDGSGTAVDQVPAALDATDHDGFGGSRDARSSEPSAEAASQSSPTGEPPAVISTQPFWVYSRVPLPVVDEMTGVTVFEIGPGAWALAIVDRGSELVIRHDDGRVGVLRSVSGLMRG